MGLMAAPGTDSLLKALGSDPEKTKQEMVSTITSSNTNTNTNKNTNTNTNTTTTNKNNGEDQAGDGIDYS